MMYVYTLAAGLLAVTIIAALLRDMAMIRGALALLINWAILSSAAYVTGDQYNVPLNMAVDWATIIIGFAPATQLPQVLMAISFGIGMMFHADHLFKLAIGVPLDQLKHPYWWRFYHLAWAQVVLMLGWEGHGCWQLLGRYFSRIRGLPSVFAQPDLASVPLDRP